MKKAVCRRCPGCSLYSDITVEICMCGTDLSRVKQVFIDIEKDSFKDKLGEINDSLSYYVQRCSTCGRLNYTTSKSKPFLRCYNCSQTMIASVVPASYIENNYLTENIETSNEKSTKRENSNSKRKTAAVSLLKSGKKKNIPQEKTKESSSEKSKKAENKSAVESQGGVTEPKTEPKISVITLTAVNYNSVKCVIKAPDAKVPVMFGREAMMNNYLKSDMRVGKAHCYVFFHGNLWYVVDNKSTNGTFVNQKDIGYNRFAQLKDGDKIKFGHSQDSPEVIVSIGYTT